MFLGYNYGIMLKRLVIKYWPMLLLLILIVAVLCMSRYAENRKAEKPDNSYASSPQTPIAPSDAGKSPRETYKPQNPPSWIDTFTWPEGVTAWSLLLTLIVIAFQSIETHAAADATAASVEAAKVQAGLIREQMVTQVERERARLNLEVQPIEIPEKTFYDGVDLSTCIKITNVGHSNAYVKDGAVRFALVASGQGYFSPASPEDFSPFSNTIEPTKGPVYCPVQSDYIPLRLREFAEDVANGVRALYLYGFIEYETMGIRWHRDFGYVWRIGESGRVPPEPESVVFRRPKDSRRFDIVGWWEQDISKPNTEHRC